MKFYLLTIFCLVNLLAGSFLFAQENFLIQAEIAGLNKAQTYAYLALVKKDTTALVDSAAIVQGKFTFTGKVAEPNVYRIFVKNLPGSVLLVVENTTITIKAAAKDISKARISGSALTDERTAYQAKYVTPALEEIYKNDQAASAYFLKGDSIQGEAYEEKNRYIRLGLNVSAEQYLQAHPQSFQSLSLLDSLWRIVGYKNTDRYLQAFPPSLQNHSIAHRIRAEKEAQMKLEAATSIGAVAPEFTQPDTNNIAVRLHSFRGKYVLIDFWASWCGPCRRDHPELVQIYEKYHADGFEIISVSLDDEKEKWLKAVKQDQLPWIHVSDLKGSKNQAAALYGVKFIPNRYLLDQDGKIIAKIYGMWGLDRQLQKLLAKPKE